MELILTVFKILYRSGICLFMTFLISCTTTQTIWQSAAPVTPEITKNIEEQKQKMSASIAKWWEEKRRA